MPTPPQGFWQRTQRLHEQRVQLPPPDPEPLRKQGAKLRPVRSETEDPPDPEFEIGDDPELSMAWHQLQLNWLRSVPGYREQVRERLRAVLNAEDAERVGRRCAGCGGEMEHYTLGCKLCSGRKTQREKRADIDRLGREIEGCG